MVIENRHAHAHTKMELLGWKDYFSFLRSVVECKLGGYRSLTVHLPLEIQHPEVRNIRKSRLYISFGQILKRLLRIKLYWENAPLLDHGKYCLKYGNTDWTYVPHTIDLCLDTGHLMLGCQNKREFLEELKKLLKKRGKQIKFLHLNENNLISDDHNVVPGKIITKSIMELLTENRDFIIEKPWS